MFHERGVKVFAERAVEEFCRCSNERIEKLLKSFSPQERGDMIGDDGRIGVTCEFCGTLRSFDPADFDSSSAKRRDRYARSFSGRAVTLLHGGLGVWILRNVGARGFRFLMSGADHAFQASFERQTPHSPPASSGDELARV